MCRSLLLRLLAVTAVLMGSCGEDAAFTSAQSSVERVVNPEVPSADAAKLQAGNAAFAFDLYRELGRADATGNLFFSPHSISTALAMTYAGAWRYRRGDGCRPPL